MKKIAIYTRVSTTHQIDKDSLPLQRKDLINYSKYVLNNENFEIFEDAGYSGKNTERPAYKEMISRIENNEFDYLLVWKIDRISRNLLDFCSMYENIKHHNCIFISKNEQFDTSSAMGEAMLKIILVFAELERKITGERVKSIMIDRANKGKWNGAPIPLGYKWNDEIKFPVIDPEEEETIKLIYDMYSEVESSSAVRNFLNSNNIKTKRGGIWTSKTVSDIIRNPFYKGCYRYNYREQSRGKIKNKDEWILVENNHDNIIEVDLWNKCNNIMDINANRNNAKFRSNSKIHVFASLIACGECNSNMYAKQDKKRLNGFTPSLYLCKQRYNGGTCNQKTISEKYIGNFIFNLIKNIFNLTNNKIYVDNIETNLIINTDKRIIGIDNNSLNIISMNLNNKSSYKFKPLKKEVKTSVNTDLLNTRKAKLIRALERLENLYLFDDEAISEKDYILKKNSMKDEIKKIDNELYLSATTEENNIDIQFYINNAFLIKYFKDNEFIDYEELITSAGRELLKEFVNSIIKKIIVKDKIIQEVIFKNGLNIKFIHKE